MLSTQVISINWTGQGNHRGLLFLQMPPPLWLPRYLDMSLFWKFDTWQSLDQLQWQWQCSTLLLVRRCMWWCAMQSQEGLE